MIAAALGAAAWLGRSALIAATVGPYVKPAIKVAGNLLKKTARPGIGSKITKGPLKLGKATLLGSARPGVGKVVATTATAAASAAAGVIAARRGVGTYTPARAKKPATQSQPSPARKPAKPAVSRGSKLCCPAGTIRKVCFKRGRTKPKKKTSKKAPSAKQLAARRKFAAMARARAKRRK